MFKCGNRDPWPDRSEISYIDRISAECLRQVDNETHTHLHSITVGHRAIKLDSDIDIAEFGLVYPGRASQTGRRNERGTAR